MTSTQQTGILVGHEKRWAALARAFAKSSVPQSLLISGPPQVGKWTFARRYAQLLLCPQVERADDGLPAPCGKCRVCHQVEIETFPDFPVFRPIVSAAKEEKDWIIAPEALEGSVITVEVARKFGRSALSKPLIGARKVMAITGADRMTVEAQNALLKVFEEPVGGTTIVLLCDNPSHLLPTVLSRCWHLPLSLAPDSAIKSWLSGAVAPVQPQWIEEAARVAAGRPGAAWRELDRLRRAAQADASDEEDQEAQAPRSVQAVQMVERIERAQAVGALALTEEALRLARLWWNQDQAGAGGPSESAKDLKKADAKTLRSAVAHFLDELAVAYRGRWTACIADAAPAAASPAAAPQWAAALDQIRKTRHYILRNANTNLALDVMFGSLIALHQASARTSKGPFKTFKTPR